MYFAKNDLKGVDKNTFKNNKANLLPLSILKEIETFRSVSEKFFQCTLQCKVDKTAFYMSGESLREKKFYFKKNKISQNFWT